VNRTVESGMEVLGARVFSWSGTGAVVLLKSRIGNFGREHAGRELVRCQEVASIRGGCISTGGSQLTN
jgi:hypothetical protein